MLKETPRISADPWHGSLVYLRVTYTAIDRDSCKYHDVFFELVAFEGEEAFYDNILKLFHYL